MVAMIRSYFKLNNQIINFQNLIGLLLVIAPKVAPFSFLVLFAYISPANQIVIETSENLLINNSMDHRARPLENDDQAQSHTYFPLVYQEIPPLIAQDPPIWAHNSPPEAHEVALFRHKFSLNKNFELAELHIFADTRYEVWIDGAWIGRGPARFSLYTREFDVYPLNTLSRGEHLISVLVQWAPNNRRSESTTPYLKAHIEGNTPNGLVNTAHTNHQWKVLLTEAWRRDAVPVHTWGLIGPTELIDLRLLPENWYRPGYDDSSWGMASVKDIAIVNFKPLIVSRSEPSENTMENYPRMEIGETSSLEFSNIVYQPRSIPILENILIPITIIDKGVLSPGRAMCEILPGSKDSIRFSVIKPTIFSVEFLSDSPPSDFILIDKKQLNWQIAGITRPDVYIGSTNLDTGSHILKFSNIPDDGVTFVISTQDIELTNFPFQQSVHAGRRTLLAEPISQSGPIIEQSKDGVKLVFDTIPGYAVLDLGRTVYGRISATVSGTSGTILDIGWDERLLNNTLRPLPYPGSFHPPWNQTDSWVLDHNHRQISTIDARAGRYILVEAWGTGHVTLDNIQVQEERYPLTEIGSFSSSDLILNKIWMMGVNTLYSNLNDSYSDPWRERGQWWGDAYVINKSSSLVFGEEDLLKRGIIFMEEAFSNGRPNALAPNGEGNHMLDYGMLWVSSVADYIRASGDLLIIEDVYPTMRDFLAYLKGYVDIETELIDIPPGYWNETVYIDTIGSVDRNGISTTINAMYYGTLLQAADIADFASDTPRAMEWRRDAETIRAGINEHLYNSDKKQYISSIYGNTIIPPSPHAQAWALAYDVVPPDDVQNVANSLLNFISYDPTSPEFEVYGTFWVLSALGRSGFINNAIDIIKIFYGNMLDNGATTTWEIYNANKNYSNSLSHGWGSSPTWFLSTYILGLNRIGPNTWEFVPSDSVVNSVSGSMPLKNGVLRVSWEKNGCQNTLYYVSAPTLSEGKIVLSNIDNIKEIKRNGKIIWSEGNNSFTELDIEANSIQVNLPGGDHILSIIHECK